MKIYTKTGDEGTSSLFNGERRGKTDPFFAALGDVDELNANVGLAREHCLDMKDEPARTTLTTQLSSIQSRLLDIGSAVATPLPTSSDAKISISRFSEQHVEELEGWIDQMDQELPTLTTFILPSGGKAGAQLHVTRAVCRRCERSVVVLADNVPPSVSKYMNRLSDYLFTAARLASHKGGYEEVTYKKARA
jgi:cob(I)alamin adenosyltransferase